MCGGVGGARKSECFSTPRRHDVATTLEKERTVRLTKPLRSHESQAYRREIRYLQDLGCPHKGSDNKTVLDWLLGMAVHLEYSDDPDKYAEASKRQKEETGAPKMVHANPLDDLDFDCQEFRQGVQALAQFLGVTQHPDHIVTLQARHPQLAGVCALIQERLSPAGQEAIKQRASQGKPYPLKESSLGFDTGDPVLNQASKVLRLLYVQDLRDLQTRINEAIVAVQAITANPKTDTRLGKVGF
ncbi:hypothetical protein HPB48_015309 [Haemaphysalis longicornis]|uniref:RNA transcription, translation and transport factor protein n=1 Tax=Haemaphysalis longicornis TaxID=44386 RepID=A0A9J6H5R4_HAELO|nr:hypothetical protein HPB48_015309 [Haemaphysalis longicornis]